jgi:anti-sigma factor RsiW
MKQHAKYANLLNLAAANALEKDEQQRVEDHIAQCSLCREEYDGWLNLMEALKQLPAQQAPAELLTRTQRLLELRMIDHRKSSWNWAIFSFLVLFSWMITILNWFFVRSFDISLARWLDVSSTAIWAAYIGLTWLATALAAGLLGKHLQHREGNI